MTSSLMPRTASRTLLELSTYRADQTSHSEVTTFYLFLLLSKNPVRSAYNERKGSSRLGGEFLGKFGNDGN